LKKYWFAVVFLFLHVSLWSQDAVERKLKASVRSSRNQVERFERQLKLARHYRSRHISKADSMRQVLLASKGTTHKQQLDALLFSAEFNLFEGRTLFFNQDAQTLEKVISKKDDPVRLALAYRYIGWNAHIKNDFNKAGRYLHASKALSLERRNNAQISESNLFLARHFVRNALEDSAMFYVNQAMRYGKRTSDRTVLAKCFHTQAAVLQGFGKTQLAFAKNILALEVFTSLNQYQFAAQVLQELGEAQLHILNPKDAERYFRRSLEYASRLHDFRQIGYAHSGLASVRLQQKNLMGAEKEAMQAIRSFQKTNNAEAIGVGYHVLGTVCSKRNLDKEAISNYNKALVQFEKAGARTHIFDVYVQVGNVFQKQKKLETALTYFDRALSFYQQDQSMNERVLLYRSMATVYSDLGKHQVAMKYLNKYLNYMDSSAVRESSNKLAELNEQYESDQKETVITSQADSIARAAQERALTLAKLENSQLRNNLQVYIIIGCVLIILLGFMIGFYRWNQTQLKQQQREAEMSQTLLRSQMNPHFIFNAMSVIQSYIYENDTVNSSRFLVNFSRLMRLILENSPKEFIPLETEVEILQKYLETQKLRFGERFTYSIEVSETILPEHTLIPPMIAQPFIENAIEHGQLHTIDGGFIHVFIEKVGNLLRIEITDNGVGRKASEKRKKSTEHKSMAMDITKARIDNLNQKYRTDGFLLVEDFDKNLETGTKVLISLPYRDKELKTTA
jgi:tetratricopeptide (TPR) repeat protein